MLNHKRTDELFGQIFEGQLELVKSKDWSITVTEDILNFIHQREKEAYELGKTEIRLLVKAEKTFYE